MVNEDVNIVLKKVRSDGLVMSRVPKPTRDAFISLADEEFVGDYGLTLKYILDSFQILKPLIENAIFKLDNIIELIKNQDNIQTKTTLSGKRIKYKGGSNE